MTWLWVTAMQYSRLNDNRQRSLEGRAITRRVVLSALGLVGLASCGRKGPLELPPEDEGDDQDEPGGLDNPDTYGDPMTFPEPGEDEESAE